MLSDNAQLAKMASDRTPSGLERGTILLTSQKNLLPSIEKLGIYDKNGVLLAENLGNGRTLGNQLANQAFFSEAVTSKTMAFSGAITSPITDKPTIAIAAPLKSNGKVWGVMVGLANFDQLREYFSSVQGTNTYTTILDKNGGILLDSRKQQISLGDTGAGLAKTGAKIGTYETTDPVLKQKVTRSYQVGPVFTSVLTKTNQQVYELSRRILYVIIIAAIAINVTLDILYGVRVSRMNSRINDLTLVVKSLNKGGTIPPIDEKELNSKDDLGELAQEIDKLAKARQPKIQ